jgi:hypothetical protein
MYNTTYNCTYNATDVFTQEDNLNEKEKEFVLDCLYRNDILYIFDLEDFETEFHKKRIMDELYDKLKHNSFMVSCMQKLSYEYGAMNDDKIGLAILYSFDFLWATHPCVCELFETGDILPKTMDVLKKKVFPDSI